MLNDCYRGNNKIRPTDNKNMRAAKSLAGAEKISAGRGRKKVWSKKGFHRKKEYTRAPGGGTLSRSVAARGKMSPPGAELPPLTSGL